MRFRAGTGWFVPALFAVAAIGTGTMALDRLGLAIAHPTGRAYLVAAYAVLRTIVSAAFAIFTIGRAAPRRPARRPLAFVACAVAMGAVVALGDPPPDAPSALVIAGEVVAVGACAWLVVSVCFLGRCFGVLPEARGLVTRGPYGLVRHPVYLGEIGACVGLAIAAPTAANAFVVAALGIAQAIRMRMEEGALRAAFPEYEAYARRVPRLIPLIRPGRRVLRTAESAAHY